MDFTAMMSSTTIVLAGAAVALVWMAWSLVSSRKQAEQPRPRRQRPPTIIRA